MIKYPNYQNFLIKSLEQKVNTQGCLFCKVAISCVDIPWLRRIFKCKDDDARYISHFVIPFIVDKDYIVGKD